MSPKDTVSAMDEAVSKVSVIGKGFKRARMRVSGLFITTSIIFLMALGAIGASAAHAATPGVAWSIQAAAQPTSFSSHDLELETVRLSVSASAGTFILKVEDPSTRQLEATQPLPYNAPATGPGSVEAALNALPQVANAGGSLTVSGGPGDPSGATPYLIVLGGKLAGTPLNITAEGQLSGGNATASTVVLHEGRFIDQYTLLLTNVGSQESSGAVTVTASLPAGLTTSGTPAGIRQSNKEPASEWNCTPGAGQTSVSCTSNTAVPPFTQTDAIVVPVKVASAASGILATSFQVAGGGAPTCGESAQPACAATTIAAPIDQPPPPYTPLDFTSAPFDAMGAIDTHAGDHPGALTTSLDLPSAIKPWLTSAFPSPVQDIRQIVVDLPAGIVGNSQAAPTCTLTELANTEVGTGCPPASIVGVLALIRPPEHAELSAEVDLPIYNIIPEHGLPAEFGVFDPAVQRSVLMYASVRTGSDYGVRVTSAPLPRAVPFTGLSVTFFGNPAVKDQSPTTPLALLTNPSNCQASGFTTTLHVDSWQNPGRIAADGTPDFNDSNWKQAASTAPPVTGCDALQFNPTLAFAPEAEHSQADEPSGYEALLKVPQNEDPNGLATPPLKNAVVTLPAGVSISPSAADGLVGCQATGPEGIELETPAPGHCPPKSKVGEAEVQTPLLKEPLKGSVYIAQPTCGGSGQPECTEEAAETGGVFALYLEVGSENSGVHIKLKGKIEVGGSGQHNGLAPGQIRTTFANAPQQPFSELKLKFNGGPRAPLANPQSCGALSAMSALTPWSASTELPAVPSAPFTITGCTTQFAPSFSAGTVNPQAGAFSPFTLTFARHDREQDLAGVTVHMPPGLLAKFAGILQCPEAQANAGTCSAASRIGSATAAAGAGSHPFYQTGTAFFTGPYKGAPFGLSVVVPAKAGPFNLGNIVVRASITIDPHTTALTIVSDPLPQIIDGVPLRVQTINVTVDREGFMLNPTSCEPTQISATLTGTGGASVPVASRFQAGGCASLPFKPTFSVSTQAHTSKVNGASLDVKVTQKPGEADIHKVDVALPLALPSRLTTLQKACPEALFAANPAGCPAGSVVGMATAHSPLPNVPLIGPAYLVSHGGAAFPDLVAVLQGEGITIDLVGNTDIKKGITYSRFETVPDAPISSFELYLPEQSNSVLAAYGSLCAQSLVMPTTIVGQNGAQITQSTSIAVTGCGKPSIKITKAKIKGNAVLVTVTTTQQGTVTVSGSGLKTLKKTLGAGAHQLKVSLTKNGRVARKHHKKTKVKASVKDSNGSSSKTITLKL
jgi:hypothetical protein